MLSGWRSPDTNEGRRNYINSAPVLERIKKHHALRLSDQASPVITDGHQAGNNRYVTSIKRLTSSNASTENRGALNPEHSRWLMGFPPEWASCAPTEMPSSRKSQPNSSRRTKKSAD